MTDPKKWYSMRKSEVSAHTEKRAEVWVYGDIGESWSDETITAREFVKDFAEIDAEEITVRINSQGGSVPDGLAIYNAMRRHSAKVITHIDGMALSIASVIAAAGDEVHMAENAMLMIHAPWTYAAGNANELRDAADQLDAWAQTLATSYAAKTGDKAAALALLEDGKDHYMSAQEALDAGFITHITEATPAAALASADDRFRKARGTKPRPVPAAAAAQPKEGNMPQTVITPDAAATNTAPAAAPVTVPDAAAILAVDRQRRADIRAAFKDHSSVQGVAELQAACEDDSTITVAAAGLKLLAHLGAKQVSAIEGSITTVEDESDKRREGVAQALMARAAVAGAKQDSANPFRGTTLLELAKASAQQAGFRTDGKDSMQVVAAAFTQTTSDFPVLMENVMHKTLLASYAIVADTWREFCAVGSVSDFRIHNRYRVGSLGNLPVVQDGAEYTYKPIPDGEKSTIAVDTKGYIIALTRQAIINDDLGAFVGLANSLGRAAARTIEQSVYNLLAENSGMGPTMADGKALFHTDHGNIASAGVLSIDVFESMRLKLAGQMDVSRKDYLDLRPSILLTGMSQGGKARVINLQEFDDEATKNQRRPNIVRNLFGKIVDTPRIATARVYAFADPATTPTLEVAFLNGNQTPFLEQQQGFTVDGAAYKVRLDFGVAAVDYRGAVTAKGEA